MNENEIKNKQIEEIKESVINKVRDLFGKAKDDLQIKRRLDILIQRDVPDILESNGIRNVDENVQDVLFESLEPVYNLDKNLDEKENTFNNTLNYSIDSKRKEIIKISLYLHHRRHSAHCGRIHTHVFWTFSGCNYIIDS